MNIETKGLGAGSYPEPSERRTKDVELTLKLEYTIRTEVPKKWNKEDIQEDVRKNTDEYIDEAILEDFEVIIN